jgi:hypothetical protein
MRGPDGAPAAFAEAALAAGLLEDASAHAAVAVELARRYRERGNEAHALWLSGHIALRGGLRPADEITEILERALAEAAACRMQPIILRCRHDFAELRARGPAGGADALRSTA